MEARRHVIIGAGPAGMAAAAMIRRHQPDDRITVISGEAYPPYFRPLLPLFLSGHRSIRDIIMPRPREIELKTNCRVTQFNTRSEMLNPGGGAIIYDRLLIATGSSPQMPPVAMRNIAGVECLRSIAQAHAILNRAKDSKRAVLLGGGILSVKTAPALKQMGIDVTIIEREKAILPRLMPTDAAELISDGLHRAGINIITGQTVVRLHHDSGGLKQVTLSDGQKISCQLLLIAIGNQPNMAWLEDTPINRLPEGVLIDDCGRTNQPNIFAAGDVACTAGPDGQVQT